MSWLKIVVVVSALSGLSCGVPFNRKSHAKRQTERTCVQVASAVGELISRSGDILPEYLNFDTLGAMNELLGWDPLDQESRVTHVCQFEGLSTLSEFQRAFWDTKLEMTLLRMMYGLLYFSSNIDRLYTLYELQNPWPWSNEPLLRAKLKLHQDLEAFGFLSLDNNLEELLEPLLVSFVESTPHLAQVQPIDIPPESTLSDDEQVEKLAEDVLAVWTEVIREEEQWNPDASQDTLAIIRNVTGLEVYNTIDLKETTTKILNVTKRYGTTGLLVWLDFYVFDSVLKAGYPLLVDAARYKISSLQSILGQETSNYINYNNYYGYGPNNYKKHHKARNSKRHQKKRNTEPNNRYYGNYGIYGDNNGIYGNYGGNYIEGDYYAIDPYNNYYNEYSISDVIDVMSLQLQVLEGLELMGLFDLTDDIN